MLSVRYACTQQPFGPECGQCVGEEVHSEVSHPLSASLGVLTDRRRAQITEDECFEELWEQLNILIRPGPRGPWPVAREKLLAS